jgi:hypothetical protein
MLRRSPISSITLGCVLLATTLTAAQAQRPATTKAGAKTPPRPAETELTGMYTFLQEGEFVQITVERVPMQNVGLPERGEQTVPRMVTRSEPGANTNIDVGYDKPAFERQGIDVPARVTGFVSRFGDLESDKGAFLDHFFTKGTLYGSELSFTTKAVHGVWFEFKGKVERGAAKARAEEGFYVIRGTLKRLTTDANKKTTSQSRELVMKSFPDLDAQDTSD